MGENTSVSQMRVFPSRDLSTAKLSSKNPFRLRFDGLAPCREPKRDKPRRLVTSVLAAVLGMLGLQQANRTKVHVQSHILVQIRRKKKLGK